jgi:hypothetical protein
MSAPAYNSTPGSNNPTNLLMFGQTAYAFGSFNAAFLTSKMSISNVALTSNVATITVAVYQGQIPAVGSLISVKGTTSTGGLFNVSNVAIASVSIDATSGKGTITFALVHADVVSAPDTGTGYVPVPEVGDALANSTSQAFAVPEEVGMNDNAMTITWSTNYPSVPSTVTMTLQGAMVNQDSQFVTLDTSTNTGGEVRSLTLRRYKFLRVAASNVSGGTLPSAIVRIDI